MRKTKEVLRLRFEVGLGLRQIARSCSIGLGTVHDYLQRAEAAGVTWPLGEDWDEVGSRRADLPVTRIRAFMALTSRRSDGLKTGSNMCRRARYTLSIRLVQKAG